jgi:hypothetical protein
VSQSVPWVKVWWTWYTSRSHIGLSPVALALGAPLMLIGRACAERHGDGVGDGSGDDPCDTVWLKNEDGSNVTPEDVASVSRFDVESTRTAMMALVGRKTLVLSSDGCFGISKFWKYQESAAAARTRKYRTEKKRHGDGVGDGSGDDKRIEVRGKSNSASPKQSKPRQRTERDDLFDLALSHFEATHKVAHGVEQGVHKSLVGQVVTWAMKLSGDRPETLRNAINGFFSAPYWQREGRHPFVQFAKEPGSFVRFANCDHGQATIESRVAALRAEKRRYCAGPDFSIAEQNRIDAEIQKLERQLPRAAGAR